MLEDPRLRSRPGALGTLAAVGSERCGLPGHWTLVACLNDTSPTKARRNRGRVQDREEAANPYSKAWWEGVHYHRG